MTVIAPKSSYVSSFNDVTQDNFQFYYTRLLDIIKPASYIALDLEFTGLCKSTSNDMTHRYVALKEAVEKYSVVSFGLSVFRKADLITQDPPRSGSSSQPVHNVSKEISSDFGLSSQPVKTVATDFYHTYYCDNFNFLVCINSDLVVDDSTGKFLTDHNFSFDRLFQKGVRFLPPSQQKTNTLSDQERKDAIKLTNMWNAITDILKYHNIPLIVHNGIYDMMFLYHSFLGILPDTLREFESRLSERFSSGIYDTKQIVKEYGPEFSASFLSYAFNKADRIRQNRFNASTPLKPYFQVIVNKQIDPLTPNDTEAIKPIPHSGIKRRLPWKTEPVVQSEKIAFCKAFAERGYCSKQTTDPLHQANSELHDIQRILDHEMGFSKYKQVYLSDKSQTDIDGAHAAHFDAYMTAFVFCYFNMTLSPQDLKEVFNKIHIDRSIHPLRLPSLKK
ncbi:ribonuclease H-like domain-containing protein [Gilbertella persicaria]|uniref:ribonuclease H-like domain-containing protein n=1 Tax=Gilbertella persicaria TaxID=101096 RepID=UPI00221E714D|nr:ribonuclease H-like domain-containing protein [Gilbertella persicaria]KAI8083359.1 ribonuclease H-like domain-containing protein [Gilbertella persicaria]